MDDVVQRHAPGEPLWEPTRRADGSVEISANYEHDNGRLVFECVSLERYRALLVRGALKWQLKGLPRPEHNPTLERTDELIRREQERRAQADDRGIWSASIDY